MGNQISGGEVAEKLEAKVGWLQRIPFIFESKVLPLNVQKQKKYETAYTQNT
jgi:hypothetical protein